jgi:hypothetical protein
MVEILTGALLEWIARNSDRLIDQENAMVVVERSPYLHVVDNQRLTAIKSGF